MFSCNLLILYFFAIGAGVADTDFILYVSTLETERCNVSKTVAYAAHCQQEMTFDRYSTIG